jgi:hypothetical protein
VTVLLGGAAAQQPDDVVPDAVEYVGAFSQLDETGEHVYGYVLQLWREQGGFVGLWSRADGQPADFPTVRVEDVRFDEGDGSLRFSARWCDEVDTFEGTWNGEEIAGELRGRGEPVRVTLRRGESEWPLMSRADWKVRTDEIVRLRAPKCP